MKREVDHMARPATSTTELLRPHHAAVRMDCSPAQIYKLVRTGKLPAVTTPGGSIRISVAAIDAYLAEQALELHDEDAAQAAAQAMVDHAREQGIISKKPTSDTLARIARAIRAVNVA